MSTFTAWLESDDQYKCVLLEVSVLDTTEKTLYFSSRPFNNSANIYSPVLNGDSITIFERMSLSNGSGTTIGDIELNNADAALDGHLGYVWSMRPCRLYFGDVRWNRSDFQLIFDGITEDIGSRDRDVVNITVRDKLQRLNVPLSETVLGGSTQNKDVLLPLTFGECFNITPLLIDPATLKYQVHNGKIERVIEVRDNGVNVANTANVTAGTFVLTKQNFGLITASVQGDKNITWNTNCADMISYVVQNYGYSDTKFLSSEIDTANFTAYKANNTSALGIYVDSSTTVLDVVSQLAASTGGQLVISQTGKLQLQKIDLSSSPTESITDKDIVLNSLQISQKLQVQGSFRVGYARNWTIQEQLETNLSTKAKNILKKEFREVYAEDSTVKTNYKQLRETERIDTLLLKETDASALANYMLNIYKTPRFVYQMQVVQRFLNVRLGTVVTLTHSRFGLSSGKTGQIIGISRNYGTGLVTLEVLV